MLVFDLQTIGNRLLAIRKKLGMTQAEVAEAADISDRTYAEIERGTVNMRVETLLGICRTLRITPDEVLTDREENKEAQMEELLSQLDACTGRERQAALELLRVYLRSVS